MALAAVLMCGAPAGEDTMFVYLGTYTQAGSKGIYVCRFNKATGHLSDPQLAAEAANPSFLALHPSRKYLYACNELESFNGKKGGGVTGFSIDHKTGKLTALNSQATQGGAPCHLVVDKTGHAVLAANYSGGSVCSIKIGADGKLGEVSSFVQHTGHSADKGRQEGPHAHCVTIDAENKHVYCADLGLDKVFIYDLNPADATIHPAAQPYAETFPGAGPRHIAIHPSGKFLYVIDELNSTVTAFTRNPQTGGLTELEAMTTLPAGFKGTNYPAEIVVHPSGKFLYGSNRGHDSIALFLINPQTGKLYPSGHASTQGKNPRNFTLDPTGHWLLAANQDTDNIAVYRVDQNTGALTPTGQQIHLSKPVCITFLP